MVLDPIPQSLPVHFLESRPQPPTSRLMHLSCISGVWCSGETAVYNYIQLSLTRFCMRSCTVSRLSLVYEIVYSLSSIVSRSCIVSRLESVYERLYTCVHQSPHTPTSERCVYERLYTCVYNDIQLSFSLSCT